MRLLLTLLILLTLPVPLAGAAQPPFQAAADPVNLVPAGPEGAVLAPWREWDFGTPSTWRPGRMGEHACLRVTSGGSDLDGASGLIREQRIDLSAAPLVSWTWRVDAVQAGADITQKGKDDYAAAVFLLFAKPKWWNPRVPVLAYYWTNDAAEAGQVVIGPRSDNTRGIVLRAGTDDLGKPIIETRNAAQDYERVFGAPPPGAVRYVALWADADQTGERADACFAPAPIFRE